MKQRRKDFRMNGAKIESDADQNERSVLSVYQFSKTVML